MSVADMYKIDMDCLTAADEFQTLAWAIPTMLVIPDGGVEIGDKTTLKIGEIINIKKYAFRIKDVTATSILLEPVTHEMLDMLCYQSNTF